MSPIFIALSWDPLPSEEELTRLKRFLDYYGRPMDVEVLLLSCCFTNRNSAPLGFCLHRKLRLGYPFSFWCISVAYASLCLITVTYKIRLKETIGKNDDKNITWAKSHDSSSCYIYKSKNHRHTRLHRHIKYLEHSICLYIQSTNNFYTINTIFPFYNLKPS